MGIRFDFVIDAQGKRRFVQVDPPLSEAAPAPTSPVPNAQEIARRDLYAACLARGGPSFEDADELADDVGLVAATRFVREHGAAAPLAALAERVYSREKPKLATMPKLPDARAVEVNG